MEKIETVLEILAGYDGGYERLEVVTVDNGEETAISVIEEHGYA